MENDCLSGFYGDPSWATGVDCAGLVSRAWEIFWVNENGYRLKPGVSTLIDSFTVELPDYYSLRRGDALISTKKGHTFLFKEWKAIDTMWVIEARSYGIKDPETRDWSRVSDDYMWRTADLLSDNYMPYKYKDVSEDIPSKPGDANGDGKVSVSDIVFLIGYLFKGGTAPNPLCKADVNLDKKVSVADIVYLINFLFRGGSSPMESCPW